MKQTNKMIEKRKQHEQKKNQRQKKRKPKGFNKVGQRNILFTQKKREQTRQHVFFWHKV